MAVICGNQATDEYKRGNLDAAEQLANEALTLSRKIHYSGLGTTATVNLAGLAIRRLTPSTDPARRVELLNLAKAYCLDALGIARRTYDVESQACALLNAASGLLFGGLHVLYGNPGPDNLVAGFFLAWAILKSGSILVPLALHALGNLCVIAAWIREFVHITGGPLGARTPNAEPQ